MAPNSILKIRLFVLFPCVVVEEEEGRDMPCGFACSLQILSFVHGALISASVKLGVSSSWHKVGASD